MERRHLFEAQRTQKGKGWQPRHLRGGIKTDIRYSNSEKELYCLTHRRIEKGRRYDGRERERGDIRRYRWRREKRSKERREFPRNDERRLQEIDRERDRFRYKSQRFSSLKQTYHSYKKRFLALESSLDSVGKGLNSVLKKRTEYYEEKIQAANLQHAKEIQQICENNTRLIKEIKNELTALLENVQESKQTERSFFQQFFKVDSNVELLHANGKIVIDLKYQIDENYAVFSKEESKENEISMMRQTDTERELITLIRTVKHKIEEQNQTGMKAFLQAANVLAALDRETEREREQLKTLKESLLVEQEKILRQLNEEKLKLVYQERILFLKQTEIENLLRETEIKKNEAEKAILECKAFENKSNDRLRDLQNHLSSRESEIAEEKISLAKERIRLANLARKNKIVVAKERADLKSLKESQEKILRSAEMSEASAKCEVEKLKRNLKEQEINLFIKQTEMENLIRDAKIKKSEAEKALLEWKTIENDFKEQLRGLQIRENKFAEEEIFLASTDMANINIDEESLRLRLEAVDLNKKE